MSFTPTQYGYRSGRRQPTPLPVDSAANGDISVGDHVFFSTAGYITKCAAGDIAVGVAMEDVAVPSADGGSTILVDTSSETIYEGPPDAGTVTAALSMHTCDFGGSGTINIDAHTDNNILIRWADTAQNTVYYSLILIPATVA